MRKLIPAGAAQSHGITYNSRLTNKKYTYQPKKITTIVSIHLQKIKIKLDRY